MVKTQVRGENDKKRVQELPNRHRWIVTYHLTTYVYSFALLFLSPHKLFATLYGTNFAYIGDKMCVVFKITLSRVECRIIVLKVGEFFTDMK